LTEWLYEAGIGENRAALIADGRIVEAWIEREDDALAAPGAVVTARYLGPVIAGRSGLVRLPCEMEAILEPLPAGLAEGRDIVVEIVRAAIPEAGKAKRPRVRASDEAPRPALSLRDRLVASGLPVTTLLPHQPDMLEAAGWSELLDEAATGEIAFPGGTLRLALTPAMVVIDVDGVAEPLPLGLAAAAAAGSAIRRLGLAGSIVIDFPSLSARDDRLAVDRALDAALADVRFERTATNGFGLMQIVRRRIWPSLPERIQADPARAAALSLLRIAARGTGPADLLAAPAVIAAIRPAWVDALARQRGGAIALRADPTLGIAAGHVHAPRNA